MYVVNIYIYHEFSVHIDPVNKEHWVLQTPPSRNLCTNGCMGQNIASCKNRAPHRFLVDCYFLTSIAIWGYTLFLDKARYVLYIYGFIHLSIYLFINNIESSINFQYTQVYSITSPNFLAWLLAVFALSTSLQKTPKTPWFIGWKLNPSVIPLYWLVKNGIPLYIGLSYSPIYCVV